MDDRPEWEKELDASAGDVDREGDIVPVAVWRSFTTALGATPRRVEDGSAAHRHKTETGHDLAFGCCAAA